MTYINNNYQLTVEVVKRGSVLSRLLACIVPMIAFGKMVFSISEIPQHYAFDIDIVIKERKPEGSE